MLIFSLFLLATMLLGVLPFCLVRSPWADFHPRLAICWWYSLGAIGSAAVASLCLAITTAPLKGSLGVRVVEFTSGLFSGHPLRGLGFCEAVGLTLFTDLVVLMVGGGVLGLARIHGQRQRQADLLDLVSHRHESLTDVHVVDYVEPLAYFLPGKRGRIVMTQGLLNQCGRAELEAIVAHERGHRRERHSVWLAPVMASIPFFNFVPYARLAPVAIRSYLEMAADDFAMQSVEPVNLVRALCVTTNTQPPGWTVFAWDGSIIERRLRRIDAVGPKFTSALFDLLVFVGSVAALATLWLANLS
jgi:Zn-dependent protease with chaperone function